MDILFTLLSILFKIFVIISLPFAMITAIYNIREESWELVPRGLRGSRIPEYAFLTFFPVWLIGEIVIWAWNR